MKKILILILLAIPFVSIAQQPVQGFCRSYTHVAPINSSNTTGQVVSGDSTSSMTFNNCTNLHITKCRISNNPSGNAITLNGCTNVIIDSCIIESVGQGVIAQNGSTIIKTINNYFHNILGSQTLTWHPIQYKNVNGGGSRIMYNMIEEDPKVAPYTHDQISLFQSNGIIGDSIIVAFNWIRGGQQVKNAAGNNGACAIGVGDSNGSYQSVHDNRMVNALAIAIDGSGTSLHVYNNLSYAQQIPPQPNSVAIVYFGNAGNNKVNNNLLNFRNSSGAIANLNPATSASISGWGTNTPNNTVSPLATATMIPAPMIANCSAAPVITYSPATNIYTVGTTIGALSPTNTGSAANSYSVSPALPTGLTLNTTTGTITGTPTKATPTDAYVVTATNSVGSGTFRLTITVNSTPILPPVFAYSPLSNTYSIGQSAITPWSPISTGGAVVSYVIAPNLPASLSINSATGIISGTPTSVSPLTTYTIIGTNSGGTGKSTIAIQINPNPVVIPNITYSPDTVAVVYGLGITPMVPTNTGGTGTYSITPALPSGLSISSVTGIISGTPLFVQGQLSYTVSCTNASGTGMHTVKIRITKAHITITANSQTKYQGQPNPPLTVTYAGFAPGDTPANALTTLPTVTTTAVTGSPVGAYTISATGAVAGNYVISYANGILQVELPTSPIIFRVFGGVTN